jgi:hypothetical protein
MFPRNHKPYVLLHHRLALGEPLVIGARECLRNGDEPYGNRHYAGSEKADGTSHRNYE